MDNTCRKLVKIHILVSIAQTTKLSSFTRYPKHSLFILFFLFFCNFNLNFRVNEDILNTVKPRYNEPLYNKVLYITKPLYSEQILPVP